VHALVGSGHRHDARLVPAGGPGLGRRRGTHRPRLPCDRPKRQGLAPRLSGPAETFRGRAAVHVHIVPASVTGRLGQDTSTDSSFTPPSSGAGTSRTHAWHYPSGSSPLLRRPTACTLRAAPTRGAFICGRPAQVLTRRDCCPLLAPVYALPLL